MKPTRKIISMDFRNQSSVTKGLFASTTWPRDDETIESDYHRLDHRVQFAKTQREDDAAISNIDKHDFNKNRMSESRRLL